MTKRDTAARHAATQAAAKQSASRRNTIIIGVVIGVIVLAAIFLMLNNKSPAATAAVNDAALANVQIFPILSRDHINPGTTHPAYNSNPPTNGWHYPVWADWGIYKDTIPDEYVVHNLEHGGVWISYKDSSDTDTVNKINFLVSNDPDRMIVTYRPADDTAIALAAWGVLLKLDKFDETAIKAFIQKYRYQGPENVAGNASG